MEPENTTKQGTREMALSIDMKKPALPKDPCDDDSFVFIEKWKIDLRRYDADLRAQTTNDGTVSPFEVGHRYWTNFIQRKSGHKSMKVQT